MSNQHSANVAIVPVAIRAAVAVVTDAAGVTNRMSALPHQLRKRANQKKRHSASPSRSGNRANRVSLVKHASHVNPKKAMKDAASALPVPRVKTAKSRQIPLLPKKT